MPKDRLNLSQKPSVRRLLKQEGQGAAQRARAVSICHQWSPYGESVCLHSVLSASRVTLVLAAGETICFSGFVTIPEYEALDTVSCAGERFQ